MTAFLAALFSILFLGGTVVFLLWQKRTRERGKIARGMGMVLLLVELPQIFKKEEWTRDREKEFIGTMEQFFSSVAKFQERRFFKRLLFGHPYIGFELSVHHIGEAIYFYVFCPRNIARVVEEHILSFYPNAQVTASQDYNMFNPTGVSVGSVLKTNQPFVVPLPTFRQLASDPMANIVTAMTSLAREGEGAALQIIFRPAPPYARKIGLKVSELLRRGQKLEIAFAASMARRGWRGFFYALFTFFATIFSPPSSSSQQTQQSFPPSPEGPFSPPFSSTQQQQQSYPSQPTPARGESFFSQQELIKAIDTKASQNLFEVNIRVLASAKDASRAQEILGQMEHAFYQFTHPMLNSFSAVRRKDRSLRNLFYRFSFRMFNESDFVILSSEELASIFHFPQPTLLVPKIQWLKAKQAASPVNLPQEGLLLGENVFRGEKKAVRILPDDRRRHIYTIGQTGTGKSVLLENLIAQDMEAGNGVALLDPHGDLAEKVLSLVPQSRVQDVIYFNPPDVERPIGLNMLEYDVRFPESKTFIVNEMMEIFEKLYNLKAQGFGGPVFEQYMRNAMMLVMDDPESGSTLLEVPRVLADAEFRKFKLARSRNIVVKNFWEKEAEKAGGEAALANMVPYITSKMNMFVANDIMRPIISQQHSAFSFRDVMDSKKILIVNLAKGHLGETNSYLLGMIIVGRIFLAALSRVGLPEEERSDFVLYLDEFQNVTTKSIAGILAEARKYRLSLVMAHQYIGQLEDEIKNAVFGNVGTMLAFRVGVHDAEFLKKQFEPVFDENDLVNLDNYNAYVKLLIKGQTSKAFNIRTMPPSRGNPEVLSSIKEYSRFTYGKNREEVEREAYERLSRLPTI